MIQFINVDYRSGAFALNNISLSIKPDERICVLGRNGSGKSTLLKLAAGLFKPLAGDVRCDGVSVHDEKDFHSRRSQIGFIFQNPEDQILTASVAAELAFTLENLAIRSNEINDRMREFATNFRLSHLLKRHPASLSAGEKQRLALAAALISHPKILILDEPTSYLDGSGRRLLTETVFRTRDWSVLMATQHLAEIENFDRVIFLDGGIVAFDDSVQSFRSSIYYREIQAPNEQPSKSICTPANSSATVALRNVSFCFPDSPACLSQISLDVPRGQVTAIVGDSGSGKTTLALLIAGLLKPSTGDILIDGANSPDHERFNEVGVVFQVPESAIFAETVFEEVAFGLRNEGVVADQLSMKVDSALCSVGLSPRDFLDRNPFTLSAGEQRLVAIASILALDRPIVIFDESTAGLDWVGSARIREIVMKLRSLGRTVIVISHDSSFVSSVADQTYVLSGGKIDPTG